jgi:nicotinate phosphoribosyltransferase
MTSVLPSTAWTDFYDLTTIAPLLDEYPEAEVGFKFYNRDNRPFPFGFAKKLRKKWELTADLTAPNGFDAFLARKVGKFVKPKDIEWFMNFRFNPALVKIRQEGGNLSIYSEGPIGEVWFDEIPGMTLTSWTYFEELGIEPDPNWEKWLRIKAEKMQEEGLKFVDFGTRRSFSLEVHRRVVQILKEYALDANGAGFISTSNMHLAFENDMDLNGTMGHKSFMVHAGIEGVQSANLSMLKTWQFYYKGNLGTFLPDTYTLEVALRDYDGFYARLFDSIRHDSGDPFWFTDFVIAHYKKLGIDPLTKTLIFSDGLNDDLAIKIYKYCKGKIKCAFGIGTFFTNDVGAKPLKIVIKVDKVRRSPRHPWIKVVKLSDTPGKISGSTSMAAMTRVLLGI